MKHLPFKQILVAGATGFIGRRLVETLLKTTDVEKIIVCGRSSIAVWLDPRVQLLHHDWRTDLQHVPFLRGELEGTDLVINLMAETNGRTYADTPARAFNNTVVATSWLLGFMSRHLPKASLLQVSSESIYGQGRGMVAHENMPGGRPSTLYGAAKSAQDQLVGHYQAERGLDVVTAVPCVLFGPEQSGFKCLPAMINRFVKGMKIQLGGQGGGMRPDKPEFTSRQWMHVQDCVDMLVALVVNWRGAQDRYHLAPVESMTTRDVAQLVAEILDRGPYFDWELISEAPPKILAPNRMLWAKAGTTRARMVETIREINLKRISAARLV